MLLSNLANVLRSAGLTVVEIDGWQSRAYAGQDLAAVSGVLWHHTAAGRSSFDSQNAPSLGVCVNGRSDLAGPLCHIVLGRDGTAYVSAAGLANHAGRGSAAGIPTDEGNYYFIGIEMESSGVAPWDWTPDQVRVAPHMGAALEREYLQDQAPELRLQLGHLEYSSEGKIDPAGWPGGLDGLRASINAVLDGTDPAPVNPPAPAPAPVVNVTPPPAGSVTQCVVESGDTLGGIAVQFGVDLAALISVNGITDPDLIFPGMVLDLPGASAPAPAPAPAAGQIIRDDDEIHWNVESGDTLGKIAAYYNGPSVDEIAAYNRIDKNTIIPGQKIWIPGPLVWIIEEPDTIRSIAAYYGLDAGYLASLNGLAGPDAEIYIGNTLTIKGA